MTDTSKKNIVVVGAGVTGLTTALLLQQKGYHVIVIAKYLPGDSCIEYTSPYAGAHWRTMAPNNDTLLQSFDSISYKKFIEISRSYDMSVTGVMRVPSSDYYDALEPETTDPWFKNHVEGFTFVKNSKELPDGAKIGHEYTTALFNPLVYLPWLTSQFVALGGEIRRKVISHIDEALDINGCDRVDAVVNCTGLSARYLGGVMDQKLFPSRGQVVIIRAPHVKRTLTHFGKDHITYVIPRSDGTCIIGGTAIKHDFNPFADEETSQSIIKRALKLYPSLSVDGKPLEVVRYAVGLRPSREGGPRLENETRTSKKDNRTVIVTHAYGHGGFGYQSSWGSAEYVVKLVEKGLKNTSKL